MAKRSRRRRGNKVVKVFPKRFGSDNVQVKASTKYTTAKNLLRIQRGYYADPETGKYFDGSAYLPGPHTDSMGKPDDGSGKAHRVERQPDTKFSLMALTNTPLGEVLKKLANLEIESRGDDTETTGVGHVAGKHVSETKKTTQFVYELPSVQEKAIEQVSVSRFHKLQKVHHIVKEKTEDRQLWIMFFASEYYLVSFEKGLVKISIRYPDMEELNLTWEAGLITWKEKIKVT